MDLSTLGRYGFAATMMAGAHAAVAAMPEEVSGYFLDVPALLENRTETRTSPLLTNIQAPRLETHTAFGGYLVSSAMLVNTREQPDGFIVVVSRGDGSFTALVNTAARSGLVVGKPDGTQTFQEEQKMGERDDDIFVDPQLLTENPPQTDQSSPSTAADQDVTLTVLAGFSDASAQRVGDPMGFALAQIETLNLSLRNTGLPHIQATLAGISTTPVDYVVNGENLARVQGLFPNHAKADLIASFNSSWDGINGVAYRNGRISMTHVATTSTFAHEIGHNIGGVHCPEGNGYNYGYFTGEYSSLLCRKGSWYLSFSNPARRAPDGVPLGDATTADMARVWRENAPKKSSGEGNDSQKPILLQSVAAPLECLDVLDGNMTAGAKVGLWKCDPKNPNQRWNKLHYNDGLQFRLAANPKLCLDDESTSANTRTVVLAEGSCPYTTWTEEQRNLKIRGNGVDLYLHRSSDNRLRVTTRTSGGPDTSFDWTERDELPPSP